MLAKISKTTPFDTNPSVKGNLETEGKQKGKQDEQSTKNPERQEKTEKGCEGENSHVRGCNSLIQIPKSLGAFHVTRSRNE